MWCALSSEIIMIIIIMMIYLKKIQNVRFISMIVKQLLYNNINNDIFV